MSLSKIEYDLLTNELNSKDVIIKGNKVYCVGIIEDDFKVLCKLDIKKKKRYILNKNKNLCTDSFEIFNDYLRKKKEGIRGYKTITIGLINEYYYTGVHSYAVKGLDIEGYYWFTDWDYNIITIQKNIKKQINEYINSLSSDFVKVV